MTELNTARLELRPFTLRDAEAYWPLVSDPAILRYTGESPLRSLDSVRELLATHPLRDYAVYGYGRMACVERSSGRLVGFCGLKYLEDLRETDIGYRFLPDCWGKGYATESANIIMQVSVRRLGLDRVIGLVEPENMGSVRVLEKLGLKFESEIMLGDHPEKLRLYAGPGAGPNQTKAERTFIPYSGEK